MIDNIELLVPGCITDLEELERGILIFCENRTLFLKCLFQNCEFALSGFASRCLSKCKCEPVPVFLALLDHNLCEHASRLDIRSIVESREGMQGCIGDYG